MHHLLVWNKSRNVFESLNQSRVSMIIVKKSKDFNPEIYSNFSMISEIEKKINFSFKIFFPMKFWFRSYLRTPITSGAFYDNIAIIWLYKKPNSERSGCLIWTFFNCQVRVNFSWMWAENDKEFSGKRFLKRPICPEEILSTRERGAIWNLGFSQVTCFLEFYW